MSKIFNSGGYIGSESVYGTKYDPIFTFNFVASTGVANDRTINVPTGAQSGDIMIISDNINANASPTVPDGWTLIRSDIAGTNIGLNTYYKVLTSEDLGTNVTSPDTSTTDHFMRSVVFRPAGFSKIAGVIVNNASGEATTGDPTSKTSLMALSGTPTIGFIVFAQRGSNNAAFNVTTTPAADGNNTTTDEGGRNVLRIYYKIYSAGATTINMTGDISDNGAQAIQAWNLTFDSDTGIGSYNSGIWSLGSVVEAVG
jgi:hypothetical protein